VCLLWAAHHRGCHHRRPGCRGGWWLLLIRLAAASARAPRRPAAASRRTPAAPPHPTPHTWTAAAGAAQLRPGRRARHGAGARAAALPLERPRRRAAAAVVHQGGRLLRRGPRPVHLRGDRHRGASPLQQRRGRAVGWAACLPVCCLPAACLLRQLPCGCGVGRMPLAGCRRPLPASPAPLPAAAMVPPAAWLLLRWPAAACGPQGRQQPPGRAGGPCAVVAAARRRRQRSPKQLLAAAPCTLPPRTLPSWLPGLNAAWIRAPATRRRAHRRSRLGGLGRRGAGARAPRHRPGPGAGGACSVGGAGAAARSDGGRQAPQRPQLTGQQPGRAAAQAAGEARGPGGAWQGPDNAAMRSLRWLCAPRAGPHRPLRHPARPRPPPAAAAADAHRPGACAGGAPLLARLPQ
jgi:hypothetical protein